MAPVPETSNLQTSEVTAESNTMTASRVPPMVYVDDEGLQEQFFTEDEESQEVTDITANRVTTPVDIEDDWTVPEDTVPTNVYMSSYSSHHTVQYGVHSLAGQESSRIIICMLTTSRVAH